jgi:hypothetical protein
MISDFFYVIEKFIDAKNYILNTEEKAIIEKFLIYIDEGSLYFLENSVNYALVNAKRKGTDFPKLCYFRIRLENEASCLSDALSNANHDYLIQCLKGLRTINRNYLVKVQNIEIEDEILEKYRGQEFPELRKIVDEYKWLVATSVIKLCESYKLDSKKLDIERFTELTKLTEYVL